MKRRDRRQGRFWFRAGVFCLFASGILWISHIIALANNLEDWEDALLAGMLVTSLPTAIGIFGVWYGWKRRAPGS